MNPGALPPLAIGHVSRRPLLAGLLCALRGTVEKAVATHHHFPPKDGYAAISSSISLAQQR